jgi:DNA-directed RNA polymerase subunit M/transcription elongation factor TFIIS
MTSALRTMGKDCLKTVETPKNIKTLELEVYNITKQNSDEELYKRLIYEIIGEKIAGKSCSEIISNLKNHKYEWNNEFFIPNKICIEENDEFIMNPFEVEEGVLTCSKCGNNRTYSYSKQTRSSDEPMSTFAQCMNCKFKWVYSG